MKFASLVLLAALSASALAEPCANITGSYICDEETNAPSKIKYSQSSTHILSDDGNAIVVYPMSKVVSEPVPGVPWMLLKFMGALDSDVKMKVTCNSAGVRLTAIFLGQSIYDMKLSKTETGVHIDTVSAGKVASQSNCRQVEDFDFSNETKIVKPQK